ncbi:type II toxin-antitoxin system RelE/ParE family toxin (plasmid) [Bacillus sp. PK9-021]
MYYASEEFPNLLLSKEVYDTLLTDKKLIRNEKLVRKVYSSLDTLNDFGTDMDFHPAGNIEPKGDGWWCLRIRHQKDYWRIMFRKADSEKYGLIVMFLKKENKISKKNWEAANRVARREGWL